MAFVFGNRWHTCTVFKPGLNFLQSGTVRVANFKPAGIVPENDTATARAAESCHFSRSIGAGVDVYDELQGPHYCLLRLRRMAATNSDLVG